MEQLAGFDGLRHGVEEVQAGHVLVRDLGIDADHLRVGQRRDEREVGGGGGEVDVAARLVRFRFEREPQVVAADRGRTRTGSRCAARKRLIASIGSFAASTSAPSRPPQNT